MSLILVGGTASTAAPLNPEKLIAGVRRDFTDAMHKCNKTGFFHFLITPARFTYRTKEQSSVHADFESRRCLHSLQIYTLYREVAEELQFKGIKIWFGERTLSARRVGDHREDVFMLVPTFKVPSRLIGSGLLSR